jgi:hypothetical protein
MLAYMNDASSLQNAIGWRCIYRSLIRFRRCRYGIVNTICSAEQVVKSLAVTCHCVFPPGEVRVRPEEGRRDEGSKVPPGPFESEAAAGLLAGMFAGRKGSDSLSYGATNLGLYHG